MAPSNFEQYYAIKLVADEISLGFRDDNFSFYVKPSEKIKECTESQEVEDEPVEV